MNWHPLDVRTLIALWEAGIRASLIADHLGYSRSTVLGKLKRLGLLGGMSQAEKNRRVSAGYSAAMIRHWSSPDNHARHTEAIRRGVSSYWNRIRRKRGSAHQTNPSHEVP